MSKSYLGSHPQLSRKVNGTQQSFQKTLEAVDVQAITQEFILEEQARIQDLQLLIKAYEVKIQEEQSSNIDHSESIAHLDNEVKMSRAEQEQILEQIQNCRKVQNQVTPMQYYLWKKKQRINTYDASIAELCRQVEQNREYLQRSIEEHRRLNEDLLAEIEDLQDKIANFNISILESGSPVSLEEQDLEDLLAQNNKLKEDEETLHNDITFLQENRAILEMQVIDNIDSIVSSIKNYYQEEKTSIVRDFKQIQAEVRQSEVATLTREEQSYNIDPLLNDYSYKMSEMLSAAPQSVRKHVHSVLQPLPWKSFNWSEFLGFNPNSSNVYDEYTRLQRQFMVQSKEVQVIQLQLSRVKTQLASQQQKSNEIAMNIYKVKQKLK